MSDFKFSCPKCNQSILCDTSNAGMQIPCPACQTMLTVPKPQPAAPAVPVAGKLSINKTAHAHAAPPPPGAANAPAKPAWGAKPVAPPPKKKSPLKPILMTCGVLALLAVGWFAFGAPYLEKQRAEKARQAEEAARQAEAQAKAAAEAAKPKPPKATWKLDLAKTQFPDRPAAGKHHGTDFVVETAILQGSQLTLLQTSGSPHEFVISVPLKSGEAISGKSVQVEATNTMSQPRILLGWKDDSGKPPGTQNFTKGYAMKLEFGTIANGRLSGKIYLCVPDAEQSFVAGNFEVGPKNPSAQPAANAGVPRPDPSGRSRRVQ